MFENVRRYQAHALGLSVALMIMLMLLAVVGSPAVAMADGGGFPSPTPTQTLIPSSTPEPTAAVQEPILPTITPTFVVPYPGTDLSLNTDQTGNLDTQTTTANQSSSPSLFLLALPFLGAFALLIGIVVYWMRRGRGIS